MAILSCYGNVTGLTEFTVWHSPPCSHYLSSIGSQSESISSTVICFDFGLGGFFRVDPVTKACVISDPEILFTTQPLWWFSVMSAHASITFLIIITSPCLTIVVNFFLLPSSRQQCKLRFFLATTGNTGNLFVDIHGQRLTIGLTITFKITVSVVWFNLTAFLFRFWKDSFLVSVLSQMDSQYFLAALTFVTCLAI